LHAFEAGDDHKLSLLTGKLHANLEMQARITKELSPGSVRIQRRIQLFPCSWRRCSALRCSSSSDRSVNRRPQN
jgi:hypothetical protein